MLATVFLVVLFSAAVSAAVETCSVPAGPNANGVPLDGFVSFSIEFSSFPDFAGNKTHPNLFSYNLINNLGFLSGRKPYIRVGGNTQDFALYNKSLETALVGIVDPHRSPDFPTMVHIGPSFFESYSTWPGVKFSHGFNLGLGGNRSEGWETLVESVPEVCRALSHGNLYTWEYGNEPDLFAVSAQGPVRPRDWNESTYVWQWQNGTAEIKRQVQRHCPLLAYSGQLDFMAPSLAGANGNLKASLMFKDGLNKNKDIEYFSTHNYISGATSPGVTLQGTLMNHTKTRGSVDSHVSEYTSIFPDAKNSPALIFGECNSLYNQGRPGLSNTFGAALWGLNFNLYSASVGFKRVHMHMGTNYRYQSWQPVETDLASRGTKAPYYGNIAVAAMLADSVRRPVSISSIPLVDDAEAAYAAHRTSDGTLSRITVINMHGYNTTVDGQGMDPLATPRQRQSRSYTFSVPVDKKGGIRNGQKVHVQRLMANGSDAITGITFGGCSYNRELALGLPVRLRNVTAGEEVIVRNGAVTVSVPDSSAVLLNFQNKFSLC